MSAGGWRRGRHVCYAMDAGNRGEKAPRAGGEVREFVGDCIESLHHRGGPAV